MRRNLLFLSFLAATLFSGCSNDENSVIGEESNNYGYVAVNIVQSTSAGTRATTGDFEDGTEAENTASKGLFFIFNEDDNINGAAQEIGLTPIKESSTTNPNVEKAYEAVLVIDNAESKPTAKKIVCVLNAPDKLAEGITSLSDLKKKTADYATNHTSKGTFIMSNSVYKEETKEVCGAEVTADNIQKSAAAALANPVNVYVERVAAKIRAAKAKNFANTEGAKVTYVDDNNNLIIDKELTIDIQGIEVANIAEESYLLKNITDINYTWAWDPTNKRSYWEKTPTGIGYTNQSYNTINSKNPWSSLDNNSKFETYVQPNTSNTNKTAILVTAQLKDGNQAFEFAYIQGGYTTIKGALTTIAKNLAKLNYYKKIGENSYEQLSTDDFEWKTNTDFTPAEKENMKDYEVVAQLKSSITAIYTKEGEGVTNGVATVNDLLRTSDEYRARVFTNGMCYYYVNIDQSSLADKGTKAHIYDGVIRNHIYELTLNSIKGIGVPVFDPEKKIIPDTPDDETRFYLAAQVKVLAWKVVKQGIEFEGQ